MTTRTRELTIAGPLVWYLRRGLKRRLGTKIDILRVEIDVNLTPKRWEKALVSFNEGCALLARIGLTDDPEQPDVEIDLRRWGRLVLAALEDEYREGMGRKRDAEAEGYDPDLIGRDVPALGDLAREIQKRTGLRPKRGRSMSFLEEQLEKRRRGGRRRGDEQ